MHKIILAAFLALFLMLAVCPAKDPPQVTDDTISDAVRVKLASDQVVGVLPLQVTVKDGVVTLTGSVDQKSLKSRAGSRWSTTSRSRRAPRANEGRLCGD